LFGFVLYKRCFLLRLQKNKSTTRRSDMMPSIPMMVRPLTGVLTAVLVLPAAYRRAAQGASLSRALAASILVGGGVGIADGVIRATAATARLAASK
jgi:hypothetical protein